MKGIMVRSWIVLVLCVLSGQVFAAGSGAYRIEVPDAGAVGKGSAFAGEANTPAAVYYNPAGMTQMKGQNLSLSVSLIQAHVDYKGKTSGEARMRRGDFVIPSGFYVTDLGSEKFALGLGAMSSWGLTTNWRTDTSLRYSTTKAVMSNQDYLITGAYKVNDQLSLALGVDVDDSNVDKQKKLQQAGTVADDGNFKLKGRSTAVGYRIAGMYQVNERHQFGLMYRSKIEHKYSGKVHLDNLNGAGYNYAAIFGGSSYSTDVISKSTLPQSFLLGYSYKPDAKWTFNMDVEWMDWSSTKSEVVTYPSETNATRLYFLGDGVATARDWNSVLSGAVGTEYKATDKWRLRTGYYYHQTPIPGANWEPNLPDSDCHGVTLGTGYDLRKDLTLDLAWSGIYYRARKIDNAVASGAINGTYRQWTNLLYATVTYKF